MRNSYRVAKPEKFKRPLLFSFNNRQILMKKSQKYPLKILKIYKQMAKPFIPVIRKVQMASQP
jgi:hypothetical protein